MKILVTGFEPFNGASVNPSEQIENREDKERLTAMPLEDMVTALQTALEVIGCEKIKSEIDEVVSRVTQMEHYMDEVLEMLSDCPENIKDNKDIRIIINKLENYQESGQWLLDFECDERGELPNDLKRGVLSEDLLYNLLCDVKLWM